MNQEVLGALIAVLICLIIIATFLYLLYSINFKKYKKPTEDNSHCINCGVESEFDFCVDCIENS